MTSPASPHYPYWDENEGTPRLTIEATTNGAAGDLVDLVCTHGTTTSAQFTDIEVAAGGKVSVEVGYDEISRIPCVYRVVPAGYRGPDLSAFTGTVVAITSYYVPEVAIHGTTRTAPLTYAVRSLNLRGVALVGSAGDHGLEALVGVGAGTLEPFEYETWLDGAALIGNRDRPGIVVDGRDAYAAAEVPRFDFDGPELPEGVRAPEGFAGVLSSVRQDPKTGAVTITESQPLQRCARIANEETPAPENCSSVINTGVRLERTVALTAAHAVADIRDRWVSSDGRAHAVGAFYTALAPAKIEPPLWRFPGDALFAERGAGEVLAPLGPGTALLKENDVKAVPRRAPGALSFAPAAALFTFGADTYETVALTVPARGSVPVRRAFAIGDDVAEAERHGRRVEDSFAAPRVTLTAAATTTGRTIVVRGRATDNVGVAALTVGGRRVVPAADGSFVATVDLAGGPNTIAATATDGTGLTATARADDQPRMPRAEGASRCARARSSRGAGGGRVHGSQARDAGAVEERPAGPRGPPDAPGRHGAARRRGGRDPGQRRAKGTWNPQLSARGRGRSVRRMLVEREVETEAIAAAIASAAARHGRALVIAGPAGTGKTALLDLAARRAGGWLVRRAMAGRDGVELDLVRTLFERPLHDAGLPLGDLYWVCHALTLRRPLALLVDDAHCADGASLAALAQLARRASDLPLLLIVAGHTVATELAGLDVLTTRPLSPAGSAALARGMRPEHHAAAGGNPWLVKDLAAGGERRDDEVRRRLARLNAAERRAARALALLDGDERVHLAAVAGVPPAALGAIHDRLAGEGLAHPLLAEAVRAAMPAGERDRLHRAAATALRRAGAPATEHLLHCTPSGDWEVVDALCEAARVAAPRDAVAYLERALIEGVDRRRVALLLADARFHAGLPGAHERLREAAPERARELAAAWAAIGRDEHELVRTDRIDEARRAIATLAARDSVPARRAATRLAAELALRAGRLADAERAARRDTSPAGARLLALALVERGELAHARAVLARNGPVAAGDGPVVSPGDDAVGRRRRGRCAARVRRGRLSRGARGRPGGARSSGRGACARASRPRARGDRGRR